MEREWLTNAGAGTRPRPSAAGEAAAHLLVLAGAALAAEALLLPVEHQDVVRGASAGQVLPALLAAVHGQTVSHSVSIKAVVTAQLMSHIFKANFVANLKEKEHTKLKKRV